MYGVLGVWGIAGLIATAWRPEHPWHFAFYGVLLSVSWWGLRARDRRLMAEGEARRAELAVLTAKKAERESERATRGRRARR